MALIANGGSYKDKQLFSEEIAQHALKEQIQGTERINIHTRKR